MYTRNESDITMYDEVPERKHSKGDYSFAQNYKMKSCLHLLPIACIMNTNPEKKLHKSFPSTVYAEWLLTFPTYSRNNTEIPEQNCTNNFNSTLQKVKHNHSFITN